MPSKSIPVTEYIYIETKSFFLRASSYFSFLFQDTFCKKSTQTELNQDYPRVQRKSVSGNFCIAFKTPHFQNVMEVIKLKATKEQRRKPGNGHVLLILVKDFSAIPLVLMVFPYLGYHVQ